MSVVLFEKKYPLKSEQYSTNEDLNSTIEEPSPRSAGMSYDEIMQKITKGFVYVLKPDRVAKAQLFIKAAIAFAEANEVNTKIVQHDSEIYVEFSFREFCFIKDIAQLIFVADEVSFWPFPDDKSCIIKLEYRTHSIYRNDRLIRD